MGKLILICEPALAPDVRQSALPSHLDGGLLLSTSLPSITQALETARSGQSHQFARQNRDDFRTLDVVMQRDNWLIAQVCLVYLDEPDEPTHDTRRC
jgi:hypothetical protein